jgi:hypothetical protein
MHRSRIVAFDEQRLVAMAEKQASYLVIAHPVDIRRIGDVIHLSEFRAGFARAQGRSVSLS